MNKILIDKKAEDIAKFFQRSLDGCQRMRFFSYQLESNNYIIFEASINGWEGYKLYFTSDSSCGNIFIYLTDSEVNPTCHLLSYLVVNAQSSAKYYPEKVMTTEDVFLNDRGFNGLIFFAPEDLEIFGNITEKAIIDGEEYQVLVVMPLLKEEMSSYNNVGIQAVIDTLESESRDFFSVLK